jgi:hypothetical protein
MVSKVASFWAGIVSYRGTAYQVPQLAYRIDEVGKTDVSPWSTNSSHHPVISCSTLLYIYVVSITTSRTADFVRKHVN